MIKALTTDPPARRAAVRPLAGRAAHPPAGALNGLLSLLADAPEPDKLPVYLMRGAATQLGADSAYLFCIDTASQTLTLSPWVVVDNSIRHCDATPALLPLRRGLAMPPGALRIERYALYQEYHPYLCPSAITRFHQQGYRAGLTLPLHAGGKTLGFLECMSRRPAAFHARQIELARALAEQLSVAVQCSKLMEYAARAAAQEERQRLAREIHDTLGQAFTAILLHLRGAETTLGTAPDLAQAAIGQVRSLAHDGLANARRAVDALRPQTLEHFDLGVALRRAVVQATLGMPIDVRCLVHGDICVLPLDTALQLLRIVQEALCNTLKYADAHHITIELVLEAEQTSLVVQDDGRGFDAARASAAGGFGLLSMRGRAAAIGAEFALCSAPGQGTRIRVVLPHLTGERYGR